MTRDVLEQFRGKALDQKIVQGPSRIPYEAFRRADGRQFRLKLRPRLRAWERINYTYLHRIVEDSIFGTQIGLVYSFAVIIIKGRNLQPIADAIDGELCEFVQQFDADRWELPADNKAPFVELIEFHVQTRVEASDQLLASIERQERAATDASR